MALAQMPCPAELIPGPETHCAKHRLLLPCGWCATEAKLAVSEARADGLRKALENWRTPAVLREGDYHKGMLCGVEDRNLQRDGYGAMEYGWDAAIERVAEVLDPIVAALAQDAPEGKEAGK